MPTIIKQIPGNTNGGQGLPYFTTESNELYQGGPAAYSHSNFLTLTFLDIPQGSTINSATIAYVAQANNAGACAWRVRAHDANNSSAVVSSDDYSARNRTTAYAQYTAPTWATFTTYTQTITSVIQEVINRAGWAAGNALTLLFDHYSHDDNVYRRWSRWAEITITYTPATVEPWPTTDAAGMGDAVEATVEAFQLEERAGMQDTATATLDAVAAVTDTAGAGDLLEAISAEFFWTQATGAGDAAAADVEYALPVQAARAGAGDAADCINITAWFRAFGHRARRRLELLLTGAPDGLADAVVPFRDLSYNSRAGQLSILRATVENESAFDDIMARPNGRLVLRCRYAVAITGEEFLETLFDMPYSGADYVENGRLELMGQEAAQQAQGQAIIGACISEHRDRGKYRLALPEAHLWIKPGMTARFGAAAFTVGAVIITLGSTMERMEVIEA